VYRAFDREQGCQVALKTFHGSGLSVDSEEVRYLKQEFRSLAPLAHPNLVQLYELFVADDHCFFSMELVEGTGLLTRAWYGRSHPARVDYAFLRHAVQQLVAALSVLHGRGKLHRDIKPSNLLVDDMDRLVVLDFGVVADMRRLQSAEFAGTPAYMSPEQRSMAALTPAADWYSVGVVLFEALTGDLPALDSNPEAPRRIAPWTPEDLDALAVRLRAPHPGDRPSARAVAAWIAPASPAPRVIDADLPLVGRDRELSELMQALAESRQGPVVVQVEGVSGIGKSRLIECFAQRARAEQRAVVLSSCCLPEESIRFKAIDSIIDGLSELWLQPDAPRLDREALRDGWTAVRMFPVLGALLDSGSGGGTQDALDPQEVRRQAFLALQRLLFSVAAHSPLVLWIDDAQWGDLDSAALLREVLSGPSAPHCLVVFSHRSEDRDRSPFLARVAELEPRRTLEVGRLEAPTMRALIERIIGSRDAGLCDEIAVAANGSPFLIEEMCYAFRDGAVDRDAALATVQDLMAKRIRDLSPRERILVELAGISAGPLAQDVALEAAGATRSAHPRILALRNNRLLRLTSDATGTWLQPYQRGHRPLPSLPRTGAGEACRPARSAGASLRRGRRLGPRGELRGGGRGSSSARSRLRPGGSLLPAEPRVASRIDGCSARAAYPRSPGAGQCGTGRRRRRRLPGGRSSHRRPAPQGASPARGGAEPRVWPYR
jgi:hypothetical protein